MALDTLTPAGKTMEEVVTEIDNRLPITGTTSPIGTVIGRFIGQRFIDATNNVVYVVLSTDGTAAGTTWDDPEMDGVMFSAAHGSA